MSAEKLLHAPSFVITCLVLYWSLPLSVLFGYIRAFQWTGPRNDMYSWGQFMSDFFGVKFVRVGNEKLYKPKKGANVIYLVGGSKMLVFFIFPFFMSSVVILKGVVLFKRGKVVDKDAFNKRLDGKLADSPIPGLLVYPEGMLYFAHSRNIPVQIVVSSGKEYVLTEKKIRARIGRTVVSTFSAKITPSDFPSCEAFLEHVQKEWDRLWPAAPVLVNEDIPMHDYANTMRWAQLGMAVLSTTVATIMFLLSWKVVDLIFGIFGPLKQVLYMLLFTWVSVSLVASFLGPKHLPKGVLPSPVLPLPVARPPPPSQEPSSSGSK
eukprot:gene7731-903_t